MSKALLACKRVARVHLPALESSRQPLLTLRRGAMGEAVRHGVASRCGLQAVVANFLQDNAIKFQIGEATQAMKAADLADEAKALSAFIECR